MLVIACLGACEPDTVSPPGLDASADRSSPLDIASDKASDLGSPGDTPGEDRASPDDATTDRASPDAPVACTTSRMCPGQVCDTARRVCVDCLADADCFDGRVCRANACVTPPQMCRTSRECSGMGLVCDTTRGECVECLLDTDCSMGRYCSTAHACATPVCEPGSRTCASPTRARLCDARGATTLEMDCPAGQMCAMGECRMRVCSPGAASCESATVRRTCNADGMGYTNAACPAGETCADGSCSSSSRVCTPGAADCMSATVLRTCNATGSGHDIRTCPTPANGTGGMCASGACTFTCNMGYVPMGTSCVMGVPPFAVPVAPGRGARVRLRPQFRWALRGSADGARLQVCRDRTCATVVFQQDVTGTTFTPPMDLPVGILWWRIAARTGTTVNATFAPPRSLVAAAVGPWTNGDGTDINGDGYSDLVTVTGDANVSRVIVYLGSAAGVPSTPSQVVLAPPQNPGGGGRRNSFGYGLAFVGDVDVDGYNDVVIGSPSSVTGHWAGFYRGSASGLVDSPVASGTSRSSVGSATNSFGRYPSGIGDLNGDGYPDFAVSSPAHFYRGSVPVSMSAVLVQDAAERPVGVGDLNGDGYDDVVTPQGGGLWYGGPSAPVARTGGDFTLVPAVCAEFVFPGDVNGDGRPDLVVGCPTTSREPGFLHLYLGTSTGFPTTPSMRLQMTSLPFYVTSLDALGDVNQDGYADLVVSAAGTGVWVHYGSPSGFSASARATLPMPPGANTSNFGFGYYVANVGDLNGDGVLDLAVTDLAGNRLHLYRPDVTGTAWTLATTLTYAGANGIGRAIASAN